MNGGDPPESVAEKLDVWTRGWLADAGDIENRLHGQTILTTESVDEEIGDVTTTREMVRTDTPILYHAMPPESKDGQWLRQSSNLPSTDTSQSIFWRRHSHHRL